jgi:2-methylisocitrate lyase-like PEP mutase family enzyme
VILFNTWEPGSAQAVASLGAQAIALGSHGVANAHGYEDGEQIPLSLVRDNAKRVVDSVDLPVTLDFETGYGSTPDEIKASIKTVLETGIIGVNIEDQVFGDETKLKPIDEQIARLRAVREAADEFGVELFINSRSDLFKNTPPEQHDDALLDQALERAQAYADAGADGFFLPGIMDLELIKKLCEQSPLPVNIIALPGAPANSELAHAGVSRISYGPVPYLNMIEWLKGEAHKSLNSLE